MILLAAVATDVPIVVRTRSSGASACERHPGPLPQILTYELRSGAFPGSGGPDVAVHVPPGFDATRRPGLVVYLHGWTGCVAAAVGDDDTSCSAGGDPRPAAALARQIDAAKVNALLVAVELRADMPTGEPGQLAMPGGLREMLQELFSEHLTDPLGCTLEIDALERVIVIAHSGGYQAAASVIEFGDVSQITEVDLLDGLYGAEDVFYRWLREGITQFDPRIGGPRRFVDLYTCCGGTLERSREMANQARAEAVASGSEGALYDDDSDLDLREDVLAHPIVFKRVPRAHGELPRAYAQALIASAGFERLR
jgi:hypothetical protein